MKVIKTVLLVFFVVLVSVSSVRAGELPKPELNSANSMADDEPIPGPPTEVTPIDTNIVILLIAGLALGVTVVYKNKIKKASM